MGIRIDLGCGMVQKPGYIGIDIEPNGQQIVRDARKGLPFSDSIVSEVYMSHFLEHIHPGEDLSFIISEIYRVCHNGAKVHIRVPHSSTPEAFNPLHASYWNEQSFVCFSPDRYVARAGVPSRLDWDFSVNKLERSGCELIAELTVIKPGEVYDPCSSKVSIIIVSYKNVSDTVKCLESILRWTKNVSYEVVVVNNYSKEEFEKEFKKLEAKFPKISRLIRVFHSPENLGWIGGVNKGYSLISNESDFVIFANNDVLVTDDGWLQRLLKHFTPETGAVGPISNYVIGRQSIAFNHDGIWEEYTNTLIGFFMCVRRDIIEKVGLLDERFAEGGADDHDYSIRIRKEGYMLKIARDVYVHHFGSKSFMEYLGGPENYNKFWLEKDNALKDKWGEEEVKKLFLPPLKVVIGIPERTDYVHRYFCHRLATMVKPWQFTIVDCPGQIIDESRNMIVREAKRIGAHYVLFVDDDMVLPSDLFVRLFNHQVPVVSALAFKRRPPHEPCIYKWKFNYEHGRTGVVSIPDWIKKGLIRVDATGFAAVLINMEVFDKIPDPWFKIGEFGEDIDFCMKCADADIPVYCDTDLIVQHIGDNELVDDKSFDRMESMMGDKIGGVTVEIHEKSGIRRELVKYG